MSSRKNERRQRTNIVASALGGSIFGALGGLAFAGWEVAILGWFGAGAPHDMGLVLGVAVFAITGAILGSVSGMSGLSDGNWSLAAAILTCGWLLSGKAAGWVAVLGIPGVLGTMFVVAVAVAAGQLLARMPLPPWVLHGSAVTLVAWMAFCVPLNLHVLPTPVDGLALGVDLFFGFVALFLGAVAAVVSNEKGPPVVAIVAAGALGWGAAWPVLDHERPWPVGDGERPPLVLIVVDGLRADRCSHAGYKRKTTPNLDKLAWKSYRYPNATATSSWTIPSMGTLITGRMPYRHGAGIHDGNRNRDTALRADKVTIADRMRREGYATAAVVGDMWLDTYGLDSGFERWSDDAGWGALSASLHPLAMMGMGAMGWPLTRDAAAVTDDALSFLEAQGSGDWFLMVQYRDLGDPFPYEAASMDALGTTTRAYPNDEYDAALHTVDAHIGRLLAEVPKNAWIVVVGDHGTELSESRERLVGVPALPRSGHGMYQELLAVPMIIKKPGIKGVRIDRVVSTVDLAPTLLKGMGLPALRAPEGVPLFEVVGGRAPKQPRAVVSQCVQYGPEQQASRIGDDKLVRKAGGKTPMYNLKKDPSEVNPLRTGGRNDQLEKRLGGALPPLGAGVSYDQGVPWMTRFGVFTTKIGR